MQAISRDKHASWVLYIATMGRPNTVVWLSDKKIIVYQKWALAEKLGAGTARLKYEVAKRNEIDNIERLCHEFAAVGLQLPLREAVGLSAGAPRSAVVARLRPILYEHVPLVSIKGDSTLSRLLCILALIQEARCLSGSADLRSRQVVGPTGEEP
jgi:hypothetical protein